MTEKRFKVLSGGFDEEGNPLYLIKDTTDMIGDYEICMKVIKQQATISALKEENEQLKQLLKEAEEEIEGYKAMTKINAKVSWGLQDKIKELEPENKQLTLLLKEAEVEIVLLKKSNRELLESLVEEQSED